MMAAERTGGHFSFFAQGPARGRPRQTPRGTRSLGTALARHFPRTLARRPRGSPPKVYFFFSHTAGPKRANAFSGLFCLFVWKPMVHSAHSSLSSGGSLSASTALVCVFFPLLW